MSYYTGMGDYYSGYGDPGLFGFLGGAIKGITGVAGKILPGPIGTVATAVSKVIPGGRTITTTAPKPTVPTIVAPKAPPTGTRTYTPGTVATTPLGMPYIVKGAKRRRMNVANPKALRRAIRRESGFVKLARRALKGTGYRITSRSAGRRPSISVRETGPGSVSVRR